jgi:hypothetical protein
MLSRSAHPITSWQSLRVFFSSREESFKTSLSHLEKRASRTLFLSRVPAESIPHASSIIAAKRLPSALLESTAAL